MWLETNHVLVLESNFSFCGSIYTRNQVKYSGLSRSIRSNDGYQLTGLQIKAEIFNSPQTTEIVSKVFYMKQCHGKASFACLAPLTCSRCDASASGRSSRGIKKRNSRRPIIP